MNDNVSRRLAQFARAVPADNRSALCHRSFAQKKNLRVTAAGRVGVWPQGGRSVTAPLWENAFTRNSEKLFCIS
jgi:hypothetical protein